VLNHDPLVADFAVRPTDSKRGAQFALTGFSIKTGRSECDNLSEGKSKEKVMDRMLVVVFENEKRANEGSLALQQLDDEGSIAVYAATVVAKNAYGTTAVKDDDKAVPWGTVAGTAVGAFIGILGGPAGVVAGAASGAMIGAIPDLESARVGSDFLEDVAKALAPGKVALVAEIDEEWTTPVDTRMEALGGNIFRRSLSEVVHTQHERDIASIKADIAGMKAEHAEAKAEHKAKLQARIDALNAKLQEKLDKAKARREQIRLEADRKLSALKTKAAKAKLDIKAKQEQRIASVKKQYSDWLNRLQSR
jgi:uncharacterized membrane protein